jgi:preprotein translocase subunit SecA
MTKFDESMAFQRNIIYAMRKKCLDDCPVDPEYYMAIEDKVLEKFREAHRQDCSSAIVNRYILDHISFTIRTEQNNKDNPFSDVDQAVSYIRQVAEQVLQEKLEAIPENRQRAFFRFMTLSAIDEAWVDEIEYLSELKSSIGGRQYAGRNIMQEYAREAYAGFEVMQDRIYDNMMRNIFLGEIERRADGKINAVLP